jgi:hypothetical protein
MSLSPIPISSIFLFPVLASSYSWNPALPAKFWSMDLSDHSHDSAEDPDFVIFDYANVVAGNLVVAKKMFSRADAVASNVPVGTYPWPPGSVTPLPVITPLDLTKIPAGYVIGLNIMQQVELMPLVSPTIPFTQAIKDAIFQILANTQK